MRFVYVLMSQALHHSRQRPSQIEFKLNSIQIEFNTVYMLPWIPEPSVNNKLKL
jgi:hypothetical protein